MDVMFTWELRVLRRNLMRICKIMKGIGGVITNNLLPLAEIAITRGYRFKVTGEWMRGKGEVNIYISTR